MNLLKTRLSKFNSVAICFNCSFVTSKKKKISFFSPDWQGSLKIILSQPKAKMIAYTSKASPMLLEQQVKKEP